MWPSDTTPPSVSQMSAVRCTWYTSAAICTSRVAALGRRLPSDGSSWSVMPNPSRRGGAHPGCDGAAGLRLTAVQARFEGGIDEHGLGACLVDQVGRDHLRGAACRPVQAVVTVAPGDPAEYESDEAVERGERRCRVARRVARSRRLDLRHRAACPGQPFRHRQYRRRRIDRRVVHAGLVNRAGGNDIPSVPGAAAPDIDAVPGERAAAIAQRRALVLPVVVMSALGGSDREGRAGHMADRLGELGECARLVFVDDKELAGLAGNAEVPRAVSEHGADVARVERCDPGPPAARVLAALPVAPAVRSSAALTAGMIDGEHVQAVPGLQPVGYREDVWVVHAATPRFT